MFCVSQADPAPSTQQHMTAPVAGSWPLRDAHRGLGVRLRVGLGVRLRVGGGMRLGMGGGMRRHRRRGDRRRGSGRRRRGARRHASHGRDRAVGCIAHTQRQSGISQRRAVGMQQLVHRWQ